MLCNDSVMSQCQKVRQLDTSAWDHIPTGVTLLDWEGREVIYEGCQYWVPHYVLHEQPRRQTGDDRSGHLRSK